MPNALSAEKKCKLYDWIRHNKERTEKLLVVTKPSMLLFATKNLCNFFVSAVGWNFLNLSLAPHFHPFQRH